MTGVPAIRAHDVGKRYRIGSAHPLFGGVNFREAVMGALRRPFRRGPDGPDDELWALRDVSFDVDEGEVIGVIGHNGAGKSTLLKILTGITEPSAGEIEMRGRVASLLEVGTGFHPELTGRENILLNGAILGMSRREVSGKLDEIVDFAEVTKFIDTPVKRYSSGMYLRLAFSVAAHLEPEVLLVDEVLAVGDAAFQEKCLGKMGEVAGAGRTVVFVSHNLSAVRRLCSRVIWLDQGRIAAEGRTDAVLDRYRDHVFNTAALAVETQLAALPVDPAVTFTGITVTQEGRETRDLSNRLPTTVAIDFTVKTPVTGLRVYFDLGAGDVDILVRSFADEDVDRPPAHAPGRYQARAVLPARLLAARRYALTCRATLHDERSCTGKGVVIPLTVRDDVGLDRAYHGSPVRALVQPDVDWTTERVDDVDDGAP